MAKPLKKKQTASRRRRDTPSKERSAPRPFIPTGIDVIPTTDADPGSPDAIDVAETAKPMSPHASKEIALAAGDLDASFQGRESGEEAVGGSDPTPDQDSVDLIGRALGVVEQDEKPLATTEKIEGRDRERWELDPASSEDFEEREDFDEVLPRHRRRPR
jgi:uncharacterized protein DUF6335